MHSVDSSSPKKRSFSRGLSEDESLRSIIKETESSSRRLTRSDSRAGTLKRRSDSQSEQDLFTGLPEMLELQASYDEAVQELRGLEVEREALLFQVDVLQDTLEGVEELLAEAQREAKEARLELEQERQAKKKLENMVCSLMKEVERLQMEQNNELAAPATDDASTREHQIKSDAKELIEVAHREENEASVCEPDSTSRGQAVVDGGGQGEGTEDGESVLTKLRKMVNRTTTHLPSLALDNLLSEDGVLQRPCENGRDLSPDRNDSDSVSAYEDASAETPELEDALELSEDKEENPTNNHQDIDGEEPKTPDGCILS
ncbi:leucine-rich repeat flightless-interacting protein 1 isoform X2 [Mugil cephalus]|uniref:leucine-rich repeat flightless-interacting protein 1 isoform X2 n=1 Tax=Mugil cephalus TaxID=48193 RepID=UPI001FB77557|nr:leucine-rich repeat flightless-interacting protein 1 isoform X2 [Mugil cephalus]